jgi:hypothetical protein
MSNQFYNYHPKVTHPHNVFLQMTSNNDQIPFYFGASQVPNDLHIQMTGLGLHKNFHSTFDHMRTSKLKGRGIHTHYEHTDKILLPKHYRRV